MKTKVTGEEKHYQKLNTKLGQIINKMIERGDNQYSANLKMSAFIIELEDKVAALSKENEFLKEKLGLSDEEIKKLIKASSGIDMLAGMSKMFQHGW